MNINQIGKQIVKYSSKGSTLIRKELSCSLDDFAKEGLKKIKVPQGTNSYDAVRVGRNFDGSKHFTDIFTFKDSLGNVIGKYSKKVDGDDVQTTYKTLSELGYDDVDMANEIITLSGRKIRGYTRTNGRISECFEETITKTETPHPIVTKFKRTFSPNRENIKLGEFQQGATPKTIENDYTSIRTERNLFDENWYTRYILENSKSSTKELEEIAQNPYFLPYVSPRNKFISRVANPIIDEKGFVIDPCVKTFKKRSNLAGQYYHNTIYINRTDSKGSYPLRENLVNTIGHEAGHGIWDDLASSYEIVNGGFGTFEEFGITPDRLEKVKQYAKSIRNYIRSGDDYSAYRKQFSERMARAEGYKSQQNYEALDRKIKNEFEYKHFKQFYPIEKEGYDTADLEDFFRTMFDFKNFKDLL